LANLADFIEDYLKQLLSRGGIVEIQRGELSSRFGCVPSQINYVLTTRFTPERGYIVESRRGGGGFIRLIRLSFSQGRDLHATLLREIGSTITQDEAVGYIDRLLDEEIITEREAALMRAAVQRETLALDTPVRDAVRANLLKAMITAILRS
jgi:transcriptional regulator of stress and heat shock response